MMVEWELARYDWSDLTDTVDPPDRLPQAIRALTRADSERAAEHAVERVRRLMGQCGPRGRAAEAVTPCLVSLLWTASAPAVDAAIHLLADINSGRLCETGTGLGSADLDRCRDELVLGFDAYVGCLASRSGRLVLLSCVKLVAACGRHDARLRERAQYLLTRTADRAVLLGDRDDILAESAKLS